MIKKIVYILMLQYFMGHGVFANPMTQFIQDSYKDCLVEPQSFFLSKQQQSIIEKETGLKNESRMGRRYKVSCGKVQKWVYLDSRIVRTMNQTLVVTLIQNEIDQIKLFNFQEPPEYAPPQAWLNQFIRNTDVDGITGATLTSRSTQSTLNKIKVIHRIL